MEPDSGHMPLIDPGLGFGTGHHLSTVLGLELLEIHMLKQKERYKCITYLYTLALIK